MTKRFDEILGGRAGVCHRSNIQETPSGHDRMILDDEQMLSPASFARAVARGRSAPGLDSVAKACALPRR